MNYGGEYICVLNGRNTTPNHTEIYASCASTVHETGNEEQESLSVIYARCLNCIIRACGQTQTFLVPPNEHSQCNYVMNSPTPEGNFNNQTRTNCSLFGMCKVMWFAL